MDDHETIVGRDPASDICLPFSAVSGRHCKVTLTSDQVRVEDLGSTNGTKLNGTNLEPRNPTIWVTAARIEIGDITLELVTEKDESEFVDPESMSRQLHLEPDAEPMVESVSLGEAENIAPDTPADIEDSSKMPQKHGMSLGSILALAAALICFGAAAYGLYWVATL